MTAPVTAYCGTPAIPAEVWTSWNLDPVVMLALVGLAVTCRMRTTGTARCAGFAAVALLAVIFLSPLCALSAALFSARVVHDVLLIAGAAPLLALAFPARHALPLSALVAVSLMVLWLWQVPGVYTWAIGSVAGYWLMQASLLGTAIALWREVQRRGSDPGAGIAPLLAMVAQMGLLGALIAFAPQALYPTHFYSTAVWGFSALEDQQLAGLIMWVPAIVPYLAAALMLGMGRMFPPRPPDDLDGQAVAPDHDLDLGRWSLGPAVSAVSAASRCTGWRGRFTCPSFRPPTSWRSPAARRWSSCVIRLSSGSASLSSWGFWRPCMSAQAC